MQAPSGADPGPPMAASQTPDGIRQGVRDAVMASLEADLELRGAPTLRRIAAAGVLGVAGALGATLLVARHPFGHHPEGHAVLVSTIWSGLLIVALTTAFLRIRTPGLRVGQAARIGILALGIAGLCGALCPDQHFLAWWSAQPAGSRLLDVAGLPVSSACFGIVTTLAFAALATIAAGRQTPPAGLRSFLPAAAITLLLLPGIALQSVGMSIGTFAAWVTGAALGAYLGVAGAMAGLDALARRGR